MSLEDPVTNKVRCYECNEVMPSIPEWLATTNVKFQCEKCRQKHPRPAGMVDLEPRRLPVGSEYLPDLESDIIEAELEEELSEELSEEAIGEEEE